MLPSVPGVAPHLPLYPPPASIVLEEEDGVGPAVNDWKGASHSHLKGLIIVDFDRPNSFMMKCLRHFLLEILKKSINA